MQKGLEKKFGDSKNKSKSIGKTAQKIIDFVISDPSMSAISKLRSMGILSREGADHGGYYRLFVCFLAASKPQNAIQSALCNSHHHAICRYSYQ